jgi:uncharacterized protein
MLLEHKVDVNSRDNLGQVPLHSASQYRNLEVMRMLLEHGANVDVHDVIGMVPSRVAGKEWQEEIAQLLSGYVAK